MALWVKASMPINNDLSLLVVSILIGIFTQLFMTGSGPIVTEIVGGVEKQTFDLLFIMSHVIKVISYFVVFIGMFFTAKKSLLNSLMYNHN